MGNKEISALPDHELLQRYIFAAVDLNASVRDRGTSDGYARFNRFWKECVDLQQEILFRMAGGSRE